MLTEFPGVYDATMGHIREVASKFAKANDGTSSNSEGVVGQVQDVIIDDTALSGAEKLKRRKMSGDGQQSVRPNSSVDVETKNYEKMFISSENLCLTEN